MTELTEFYRNNENSGMTTKTGKPRIDQGNRPGKIKSTAVRSGQDSCLVWDAETLVARIFLVSWFTHPPTDIHGPV